MYGTCYRTMHTSCAAFKSHKINSFIKKKLYQYVNVSKLLLGLKLQVNAYVDGKNIMISGDMKQSLRRSQYLRTLSDYNVYDEFNLAKTSRWFCY